MRAPALLLTALMVLSVAGAGPLPVEVGQAPAGPREDWGRGTRDPRMTAPGLLVPKVPPGGPDEPYAAVLLELEGAATALYLRDGDARIWRVEVPRTPRGRRLFERLAISLEPGEYEWIGFARWQRRRDGRQDVYRALDLGPIPMRVRAGVANHAGCFRTTLRRLSRVHRAERRRGQVIVHPQDFEAALEVVDGGAEARRRMATTWPWIRDRGLRVVPALVGPGDVSGATPAERVPAAPAPGQGSSWGYR